MGKLIAVSDPSKSFFLSKAGRRLLGWIRYRIEKSSCPWIQVNLDEFSELTGISRRTLERQLERIRLGPQHDVVVRTIHEDRRWKLLASTTSRLHTLKRTEPFTKHEDGKNRIVKIRKNGRQLNEEQLVLGEEPIYHKAVPNTQDSKSSVCEERPADNPAQTNFFGQLTQQKSNRHFSFVSNRRVQQVEQRKKHLKSVFSHRMSRLAIFLARNELQSCFWDNCKVSPMMGFLYNYSLRSLEKGCNRRTIVKAFDIALHEVHAIAVDKMVTQPGSWPPSSTIARASKILAENDCHNRFKPSSEEHKPMPHWSGVY